MDCLLEDPFRFLGRLVLLLGPIMVGKVVMTIRYHSSSIEAVERSGTIKGVSVWHRSFEVDAIAGNVCGRSLEMTDERNVKCFGCGAGGGRLRKNKVRTCENLVMRVGPPDILVIVTTGDNWLPAKLVGSPAASVCKSAYGPVVDDEFADVVAGDVTWRDTESVMPVLYTDGAMPECDFCTCECPSHSGCRVMLVATLV